MYVKGSIEQTLKLSKRYLHHGSAVPITDEKIRQFIIDSNQMAAKGLRSRFFEYFQNKTNSVHLVLAMATGTSLEDLTYVGIVGIIDPERPQVEEAVSQLKTGGVIVKMITGDAEKTAKAIATRLRIYDGTELSISGEDLDHMNAADLHHLVSQASIFYRVSPKHKLTIVKALQAQGHIVGMTGDGVNDAVALKAADIGIAMGQTGTDVCKEAADMILVKDDFYTIM